MDTRQRLIGVLVLLTISIVYYELRAAHHSGRDQCLD